MRERFLPRFPAYDRSIDVEEFVLPADARRAEAEFLEQYVLSHRPCVIRGGAEHWRASHAWTPSYLRGKVGERMMGSGDDGIVEEPVREYAPARLAQKEKGAMTVNAFLDKIARPDCTYLQAYAESLDGEFASLRDDLGDFRFIDLAHRRPRTYGDRMFIAKAGYTDWHVHYGDETLTVQLSGTKEFLILPPDLATWRAIFRAVQKGYCWRMTTEEWGARASQLKPLRVILEPGDVVYIPMHWWHAVEAMDDGLNITAARVFRTPTQWLTDVRIPNVPFSLGLSLYVGGRVGVDRGDWSAFRSAARAAALTAVAWPWAILKNRRPYWST